MAVYSKELRVLSDFDVVIIGAGPAGICAAVTAARKGARVALLERYGVIGGNLTAGFVGPILGMVSKGTMRDELVALLGVPENDMIGIVGLAHDVEKAKHALADFVNIPGLSVFLQCSVFDVIKNDDKIDGIVVATKEGPLVISGKIYVDCTGDGDVAFLAEVLTIKGRHDGLMQPVTLEFTIDGVDESKAIVCIGDVDEVEFKGMPFLEYCRQCASRGEIPANLAAVRLHRTVNPGERRVNTTQVNDIDGTKKISDIFAAEVELRKQIYRIADFLRTHLPGYENCKVSSSGTTVGLRETRRVMGDYILTRDDVVKGPYSMMSSFTKQILLWTYTIQVAQGKQKRPSNTANLMIFRIDALYRKVLVIFTQLDAVFPVHMKHMLHIVSCRSAWQWDRPSEWLQQCAVKKR